MPKFMIDRDGDAANNGTGFGKPAKDLSINYVPVPYPDYPPAIIEMRPGERQLWRVLNASAITYLNLAVLFNRVPQQLGIVAMDGVPMTHGDPLGDSVNPQTHIGLPPGARVEFIVTGPPEGETGLLVTRTVDTGPGGENDPNRMLAKIVASSNAPEPRSKLKQFTGASAAPNRDVARRCAAGAGTPTSISPRSSRSQRPHKRSGVLPDCGWTGSKDVRYENRRPRTSSPSRALSRTGSSKTARSELHAFHIHQLHFLLLDYMGRQVNEDFLRDTVNVPYYDGRALAYPSVRLRMDFRDPNTVGTFVYHCHLLEHEDKGMMGSIRVDPAPRASNQNAAARCDSTALTPECQASPTHDRMNK